MKLQKLIVWGCGVLAILAFTQIWHRYSGWYDWGKFPSGSFFRQVALPAILIGMICGVTIWMAVRHK